MKPLLASILALLITVTQALASSGSGDGQGLSHMTIFFISFGILIVLFQFIPGIMLFVGMLKGLFISAEKNSEEYLADGSRKNS
ncbi:MAG TPA: hypothetical protein VGJ93_14145 [Desulfuromonadaceae bacterium]|jgi:hypothetical protein